MVKSNRPPTDIGRFAKIVTSLHAYQCPDMVTSSVIPTQRHGKTGRYLELKRTNRLLFLGKSIARQNKNEENRMIEFNSLLIFILCVIYI